MYTDFASVYDRLMQDVDYAEFALVYDRLLQSRGVKYGSDIVECACGTGNISIPLSENYNVLGVDISEDMLSKASQKAKKAGKRITFIRQDMQSLRLHKPYSAVLATCDGLNYLDIDKAERFLYAAYESLIPGGALCFDISSEYKLKNIIADNTFTLNEEDICYIWQNQPERNSIYMRLDIFLKNKENCYSRIVEEQHQYIHTERSIISSLEKAGFINIGVFNKNLSKASNTDERLFFAAEKENYVRYAT